MAPFDLPDPFNANQFQIPSLLPRAQAPNPIQPFSPEEYKNTLNSIGGNLLGGLAYVGQSLDKPGRALRGLVGGKPRELLNLIPFSDWAGITNENDRVSGKDLLGFDPSDDSWTATLAGLGTEVATDPLLFLKGPGAALTQMGQAAKKIGVLPKNIGARAGAASQIGGLAAGSPEAVKLSQAVGKPGANVAGWTQMTDVAGQRLGAHVGVGLPGLDPVATFDMTGPMQALGKVAGVADKVLTGGLAGKALNIAGNLTAPVRRTLRAAFDQSAEGQVSDFGQNVFGPRIAAGRDAARQAALDPVAKIMRTLGPEGLEQGQQLRQGVERSKYLSELNPNVAAAVPQTESHLAKMRRIENSWGIPTKDYGPGYMPRQAANAAMDVKATGSGRPIGQFGTGFPSLAGREEILNGLTSETIDKMVRDPELTGRGAFGLMAPDVATAAQTLTSKYPGIAPDQATHLADWLRSLHAERGEFWDDPMRSLQNRSLFHGDAVNTAKRTFETMAENAGRERTFDIGSRTIPDVLDGMGLTHPDSMMRALQYLQVKQPEMLKSLGIDALAIRGAPNKYELAKQALESVHLPKEVADSMTHSTRMFTVPESWQGLAKAWDSITGLTKAWMTAPWAGFNARNQGSGVWINRVLGIPFHDMPGHYAEARQVMTGDAVAGAGKWFGGISDAEGTKALADLYYTRGVGGGGGHLGDTLGPEMTKHIGQQIPGLVPGAPTSALNAAGRFARDWLPTSLEEVHPLNVAGVGGRTETKNAAVAAGRGLGSDIEQQQRLAGMIGLIKQGHAPDAAATLAKVAHVDYQALTPFERQAMRRVIPFYAWMRQNIPNQIKQLVERPGGLTSQAVRAGTDLQQSEDFTPDYLSSKGLAIPIGKEDNGTQRFLSQFGLPFEDLGQFLSAKGLGASAMQAAGSLNPLIKAPLEMMTGKQFMSGRDLADLHSDTGNPLVDQLLMNSPASRVVTTAKTLADERKGAGAKALNLLTGLRLTDVDMGKARHVAAREFIENQLRGMPDVRRFQEFYVPRQNLQQMTPEEFGMLRLYRTLSEDAKKHAQR